MVISVSDQYRMESFKILSKVHSTTNEELFSAKLTTNNKKYLLVKAKEGRAKQL
jgi:hypothetical protein